MPSLGFIAIMAALIFSSGLGIGMKVTSDHYLAKEVDRVVAVVKIKEVIKVKDNKAILDLQKRNTVLAGANLNLEKELEYVRQNGPVSLDAAFVGVYNAKLAGRPFSVPGAAGSAPGQAQGAASGDDFLRVAADNGQSWGECRAQVESLRAWCKDQFGDRCAMAP